MGNKKLLKRCILPIVLISLCIPLDSIDVFWAVVKNRVEADAQYFWLHSIIYGGIFGGYFISVMSALPYADCYCQEYHQGMWRYLIARSTTSKYVVGKMGRVFLSGGFTACMGGTLFLLGTAKIMPLFDPSRYLEVTFLPFSKLLTVHSESYFLVMLYLLFLSGGFWSSMSWCFSVCIPIRYLVYLFPFIGSFMLTRVNTLIQVPPEWQLDFWLKGRSGPLEPWKYLLVITGEILIIIFLGGVLARGKIKRRLSNE